MKLINHTLLFLSVILFFTVSVWAVIFYFQLLKQVKTTVDEGLANSKIVIIDNLKDKTALDEQEDFNESNYLIKMVSEAYALKVRDSYKDTMVFSTLKNSRYETRSLTTAFVAANGKYYEMKVISPELDKNKLIRKIIISLFWLYLFLIISTVLVNNVVLKKTWKPFHQLVRFLNDFRLDKSTQSNISATHIKEFKLLNNSIQNLLNTNVTIYNSQKQFIENASHELQTPLAIAKNKLELLAGDVEQSAGQLQKVGDIIQILERLAGLNKSLLLLSKIENQQFHITELINFDAIFQKATRDFEDYANYKRIRISYQKEGTWNYSMNKDLAEMLVVNLVKNALIHNNKGGEIKIVLSSSTFCIENTSEASLLPLDKLFNRFGMKSKDKNSTGLGLAIVKTIADASRLEIVYSYNGWHKFLVRAC